jgi:site-specific DNA recombinase
MTAKTAALYARVSSQQQKDHNTIDSQVVALRDYATEEGYIVPEEWIFLDEGYSGATLLRPGLEAVRDLASQGQIEAILVHSPDRMARKYAYQVLLLEELARAGVEVIFLKSSRGDSPEDELLRQFQGMIAEYERAQITERHRRGKLHRARCGDVSVLSGAPFGYRYHAKTGHCAAIYEVIESQAQVVREIFHLYTGEDLGMRTIARRLSEEGIPTQTGKSQWDRSTIWGMLRNPAYMGKAAFAKTRVADHSAKITRPVRQRGHPSPRPARADRAPEDWIEIPVPAIVDEKTFQLAAEQLERNKRFASRRTIVPSLLQGMLVCRDCGYAYYRTSTTTTKRKIYYYRCLGSDDYRYENGRVCANTPVRTDYLDGLIWDAVVELMADPKLVRQELQRRLSERQRSSPAKKHKGRLQRELARYEKATNRLIEAYQEELITLDELRGRISDLRKKTNAASGQITAIDAQSHDEETYMKLCESLETVLATLHERSQTLSVEERQRVLRLVVKEIQVGKDSVVIKHSIPSSDGDPTESYPLRLGSAGAALRRSHVASDCYAVGHHTGLEVASDEPEDPWITDSFGKTTHQNVVVDSVKELFQVNVHHPPATFLDVALGRLHGAVCTTPRPKPVAVI